MKRATLYMLLLSLLFFSGCEDEQKRASFKEQQPTSMKPKEMRFLLKDANKTAITIELKSSTISLSPTTNITLLFFFTTWCPSCKAQIPELIKLKKEFKDIKIIGILLNKPQDIQTFLQRYSIDFFVSTSYKTNTIVADKIYKFIKAPASMPVPAIIILHKNRYFRHYLGAVPLAILQADIKALKEG